MAGALRRSRASVVLIGLFACCLAFPLARAQGTAEVWRGDAHWEYGPNMPLSAADMSFTFYTYRDGNADRVKGRGEGVYATDRVVVTEEDFTLTWHTTRASFPLVVSGAREGNCFYLDLAPAARYDEVLDWGYPVPPYRQHVEGPLLWDWIALAGGGSFQIEARNGASKSFAAQSEDMYIKGSVRIEKEECVTAVESISGPVTADGKQVEEPYLLGKARVKTGGNAAIKLRLPDGSFMKVAGNTDFEFDPGCGGQKQAQKTLSTYVKVFLGKIWFVLAKRLGNQEFRVLGPGSATAPRGTKFSVEVRRTDGAEETIIEVEEGEVEVKDLKTNKVYVVRAGEEIRI